jgi:hypothetical protein
MKLGGLLFGYGFLWSDLIWYGVGISVGVLLESCIKGNFFSNPQPHLKD